MARKSTGNSGRKSFPDTAHQRDGTKKKNKMSYRTHDPPSNAEAGPSRIPIVASSPLTQSVTYPSRKHLSQSKPSGPAPQGSSSKHDKQESRKRRLSLAFSSTESEETEPRRASITLNSLASQALGGNNAQRSSAQKPPNFLSDTSFGRLLANTGSQSNANTTVPQAARPGANSASARSQQGVTIKRVPRPVVSSGPQTQAGSKAAAEDSSASSDDDLPKDISDILGEYDRSQTYRISPPLSNRRPVTGKSEEVISITFRG